MDKFYIKIADMIILICFEKNKEIRKYLESEYELIEYKDSSYIVCFTVTIRIFHKTDKINNLQKFKARNRCFYLGYTDNSVEVFIPYLIHTNPIRKLINNNYEFKWELCIHDFFHNIFLIILQEILLKKQKTLLHASSFSIYDKNILFFGKAQSGKSTMAKIINETMDGFILSEDFCIGEINSSKVYSLPHKSRVNLNEYNHNQSVNKTFLDKLNQILFFPIRIIKKKQIRRIGYSQVFKKKHFIIESSIDVFYVIKRGGEEICAKKIDQEDFVDFCMEVLINEFHNIRESDKTAENMNNIGFYGYKAMIRMTEKAVRNLYKSYNCQVLYIPYYQSFEKLSNELKCFFMNLRLK